MIIVSNISENRWSEVIGKYWGDSQCANIGGTRNLVECQEECLAKEGCTAFNFYVVNKNCVFRACGSNVPQPSSPESNYIGYYLSPGRFLFFLIFTGKIEF